MQSWKNNLTTQLNTKGIYVGRGTEKYYGISTKVITHAGSDVEVTLGRNSKTNAVSLIDWKLVHGDTIADINDWLKGAMAIMMGRQAQTIVGEETPTVDTTEVTPSESPNQPSPAPMGQRLADPHE